MAIKYIAAVVAVFLMLAFLVPIAWKLKEISLAVVMLIGVGMMLVDLAQSLKKADS
jgi:hypothetical protein